MCSSKKLFGGLAAGWQAVCNPLSGKLACRMTVDVSIIDTGKSDKPNASEIGNWEKKFWCLQKAIFLKVVCWPVVFCFLFFFLKYLLNKFWPSYCIFLMFEITTSSIFSILITLFLSSKSVFSSLCCLPHRPLDIPVLLRHRIPT